MNPAEEERGQIIAAIDRLIGGTPLRSDGNLTVVELAVEADVKRWVLTHKHTDLKDLFNARVKLATEEPPLVQQLRDRVTELEAANADLRREVARRDQALDAMARWLNFAALNPPQQETGTPQLRLHPVTTPPATTQ